MERIRLRAASARYHSAAKLDHTPLSLARLGEDYAPPLWRRPLRWIGRNSFNPGWIGERWQHPAVGYIIATFSQLISALTTLVLVLVFPTFSFPEALPMLVVALMALSWGAVQHLCHADRRAAAGNDCAAASIARRHVSSR